MNLLSNHGISKKTLYKQGKGQLYTWLTERPGFENYLNLPNKKLCQTITKLRISAHKFPIETGRFDYRKRTERTCPLCCDCIGDGMHYLTHCQNSIISRTRFELLELFHKKWKSIHKLTQIELTNQNFGKSKRGHVIRNRTSIFKSPRSFLK